MQTALHTRVNHWERYIQSSPHHAGEYSDQLSEASGRGECSTVDYRNNLLVFGFMS